MKKKKNENTSAINLVLKCINHDLKLALTSLKSKIVSRGIIPGYSKPLWQAVKKAKDQNQNSLPDSLMLNNCTIRSIVLPDTFATLFSSKVNEIVNESLGNQFVCKSKK